jgi:hypothetical protein
MAALTKAYTINSTAWSLVAQNASEVFILANKQYDVDLYIGSVAPSNTTQDYITIESDDNFSASSLVSGTDVVYIRCAAPVAITVKVLTL